MVSISRPRYVVSILIVMVLLLSVAMTLLSPYTVEVSGKPVSSSPSTILNIGDEKAKVLTVVFKKKAPEYVAQYIHSEVKTLATNRVTNVPSGKGVVNTEVGVTRIVRSRDCRLMFRVIGS